jgi:hypothetical protein
MLPENNRQIRDGSVQDKPSENGAGDYRMLLTVPAPGA